MTTPVMRAIAGLALAWFLLPAWAQEDNPIGRFEITRFEVQGNTLLDSGEIERLLAPYTGRERDFGHVQRALEALEGAYQAHGYNVVQVALPEQELNHGVVQLHVVETRIGQIRIEGRQTFDEANIRASLPGLVEGRTPNLGQISASLKLANDNPAKKTNLQLQSGARDDEIDAILKVTDDKPWRLGLNLDNSGTASTGRSQLGVLYQHANVFGRDHVASLQYTTTLEMPSQVSVYGLGYHIPLYAWGDALDLFASYSDVDAGSVSTGLFDLQVSGRGAVYGARYTHYLLRHGDYDHKLIAGLDYKAYRNSVTLQGAQLGNDVTVRPVSLAYAGNLALAQGDASFSFTALRNLPGGERGDSADFTRVRAGADASYTLLRYGAAYSRALPADWQARISIAGQATRDLLVPGEQFGAGGASSVRGFAERDIANDVGHLVSAELYTPNLCAGVRSVDAQCRALAFYDAGRVKRNQPLPGEMARASIASIGLGWRMNVDKYLTLQLDAGHVLDGGVTQNKGDNRLHVRLGLSY